MHAEIWALGSWLWKRTAETRESRMRTTICSSCRLWVSSVSKHETIDSGHMCNGRCFISSRKALIIDGKGKVTERKLRRATSGGRNAADKSAGCVVPRARQGRHWATRLAWQCARAAEMAAMAPNRVGSAARLAASGLGWSNDDAFSLG